VKDIAKQFPIGKVFIMRYCKRALGLRRCKFDFNVDCRFKSYERKTKCGSMICAEEESVCLAKCAI
jgi:hypothetical protein